MPFVELIDYLAHKTHHVTTCSECNTIKPTLIYDCKCVICDDCYRSHHVCETCGNIDGMTCITCQHCNSYICQSCMGKKCKCGTRNMELLRGHNE
jgi:hypothetical protein